MGRDMLLCCQLLMLTGGALWAPYRRRSLKYGGLSFRNNLLTWGTYVLVLSSIDTGDAASRRALAADPGHAGHGGWVVSKSAGGKTVMSTVPNEKDLPEVRQQLEEGRRFWKLAQEFAEVSDELSRRKLSEGWSESDGQKGGLKKEFEIQIVAEIERLIGKGAAVGLDFEAIETAARREAMRIAARAVEKKLNEDFSDYEGPLLPCSCGGLMRYEGRRPKIFSTVLGQDDAHARLLPL